jgi:hypothetical protein
MVSINFVLQSFDIKDDASNFFLTKEISNSTLNPFILLELKKAIEHKATAVYFKPLETNKPVYAVAYIYDNTENKFSKQNIAEIHKTLWNSGAISIYIIFDNYEINIFNARKPVNVTGNDIQAVPLIDAIKITSEIKNRIKELNLTSQFLDSGLFHEHYKNDFIERNSPHTILLERLKDIRKRLKAKKDFPLDEALLNKLLVICILLKFLEEKEDAERKHITDYDEEGIWQGYTSFVQIFREGNILNFFDRLTDKFNGNIFAFEPTEKAQLEKLSPNHKEWIASYFDARFNTKNDNYEFWRRYSFNHLPIELISGIYEIFLPSQDVSKDVTYTPPYLVNLMIDECMPLEKYKDNFKDESFKILDPACGSGIFLVSAYRRLIEWKTINDFEKTKKWKFPDVESLQKILRDNIHGIDIKKGAQEIAIFSLQIALCRYLSPLSIWKQLRFDNLGDTGKVPINKILHKDFFTYFKQVEKEQFDLFTSAASLQKEQFDLIIGNPPFKQLSKEEYDNYCFDIKIIAPIPRYEIAFLFLNCAISLVKKEKQLSLVLPSKFIYNQTESAFKFRNRFITEYQMDKIYDFTHLSNVIFKERDIAVCSVFVTNSKPTKNYNIKHIVAQRFASTEQRLFFEFDSYDFHTVSYHTAMQYDYIWKTNLLGGSQLFHLITYFKQLKPTFGDYLKNKRKFNNWIFCEGYQTGQERKERTIEFLEENYSKATHITGFETIDIENFSIDTFKSKIEENIYFRTTLENDNEVFSKPLVLIRVILDIPIHFLDKDMRFSNSIIGIHAPEKDKNELLEIVRKFNIFRSIYQTIICSTSGYSGITMSFSTILAKDIKDLPFPENEDDIFLNKSETIISEDVLKYYIQLGNSSTVSELNREAGFTEYLIPFAETFCYIINKIHEKGNFKMRLGEVLDTGLFYCIALHYGDKEPIATNNPIICDDLDEDLQKLIMDKNNGKSYRVIKIVTYYTHKNGDDMVYLIKPKQIRYWLRSIAIKDADKMIVDIMTTEGV